MYVRTFLRARVARRDTLQKDNKTPHVKNLFLKIGSKLVHTKIALKMNIYYMLSIKIYLYFVENCCIFIKLNLEGFQTLSATNVKTKSSIVFCTVFFIF